MVVNVLFYLFGAILIAAAFGVITARNPVHCALFLVFAFLNSAVIWLLVEAEFLAITLVVVYVGAVMVLWLFVVMMMDIDVAKLRQGFTRYAPLGALVALLVVAQIGIVVWVRRLENPFFLKPFYIAIGFLIVNLVRDLINLSLSRS